MFKLVNGAAPSPVLLSNPRLVQQNIHILNGMLTRTLQPKMLNATKIAFQLSNLRTFERLPNLRDSTVSVTPLNEELSAITT